MKRSLPNKSFNRPPKPNLFGRLEVYHESTIPYLFLYLEISYSFVMTLPVELNDTVPRKEG